MLDVKITKVEKKNQDKTKVKENLAKTKNKSNKKVNKKLFNKLQKLNNQKKQVEPNVKAEEEELAKVNNDSYYFKLLIILV
jgi:hypothetical protein